jgi:hypothetical protein
MVIAFGYSKRHWSRVMSLGMSTSTGPGLPVRAMWKGLAHGHRQVLHVLHQEVVLDAWAG